MAVPANRSKMAILLIGAIVVLALGAGFAVPQLYYYVFNSSEHAAHPKEKDDPEVQVPFDTAPMTINLNSDRLTNFLRFRMTLVVKKSDEKQVAELVEKKRPFLKNWLICYVADQTPESVKGQAGRNRFRREVRDQFNSMLFPDGSDRIADILLEEFQVN
jgi:flagellar basal body-associated protein FliL